MPNLESFILRCVTKNITEDYYKKIIDKLLKMNLKKIELSIRNEPYEEEINYSEEELLEMFEDIELNNYDQIKIHKPNNNPSFSQFMTSCLNQYKYD